VADEERPGGEGTPTEIPLTEEALRNLGLQRDVLEQINQMVAEGQTRRTALNQLIRAGTVVLRQNLEVQQSELQLTKERLQAATDLNSKIELGNTLQNQQLRVLEAATREQAKVVAAGGEDIVQKREELSILQQGLDALRQKNEAQKNISSGGRLLLKTLTGISQSHRQSLTYSTIMAGNFKDMTASAKGLFATQQGWSDILGSSLQKVQEVTLSAIKTVASLNAQYAQQTGRVGNNTVQLEANWRALSRQAAGLQDVQTARIALMSQTSRFITMGQAEQNELIQLGTTLKQVGVDMGDFTKTVNFLQQGLGMSTAQVVAFENRLHGLAQQVGFSTLQINRDWAQSQSVLAKYGQDSEGVFDGLTRASKETGIATSQLIGITDQFVTFEGAANIVGKFNALLGGPYLNTIQMVYAKDHERLALLRQVFKQSGLNWNQMSEHEQLSYAMAAGIKDMALATQLWGATDAAYRKHAAEQKTLADLAKESKDVFDRFKESMMRLAVAMGPILGLIGSLADGAARLTGALGPGGALMAVGALQGAYVLLTFSLKNVIAAKITAAANTNALKAAGIQLTATTAAETTGTSANAVAHQRQAMSMRSAAMGAARLAGALGIVATAYYSYSAAKKKAKGEDLGGIMAKAAIGGGISGAMLGGMAGGLPGAVAGGVIGGMVGIGGTMAGGVQRMNRGGRTRGGPVIVGDRKDRNMRGAEIMAPRGTNVISAQQTGEILAASQINREAMGVLVSSIGRLTSKMEALAGSIATLRGTGGGGGGEVEKTVVLTVDGTTLGSVVVDVLRDRHEIGLVSR